MASEWVKPVTVTFGDGAYGLGTIQGGPFAESERFDVISPFGPRTPFFVPLAGTGNFEWVNGELVEGYWTANFHGGIDVPCPRGTEYFALGDCVAETGFDPTGYGHYFRGRRPDGFTFLYAHMEGPALVGAGQQVAQGAPVGVCGSSGKAIGAHLHLEIALASNMDPMPFLYAARDVGEPAPLPALAVGDPSRPITELQSLELQYVIGLNRRHRVLAIPQSVILTPEEYDLHALGLVTERLPAGTPVESWLLIRQLQERGS